MLGSPVARGIGRTGTRPVGVDLERFAGKDGDVERGQPNTVRTP